MWSSALHIFIRITHHVNDAFPSQHVYDQKNIRRRVYDALNVLMAMNIISKEKKEIKWIGLPTNSAQECQNLEVDVLRQDRGHVRRRSRLSFCLNFLSVFLKGGETKAVGED